jgi:hypothetical protein
VAGIEGAYLLVKMASSEVRWSISDTFDGWPNIAHPLTYLGAAGAQEREVDMTCEAPHAGVALGRPNTRCSGRGYRLAKSGGFE